MTRPHPAPTANTVVSATGLLAEFNRAGVLVPPDVHVAQTLGRLCGEGNQQVLLAVALAVRALRLGSVCLQLTGLRERVVAEMLDPALDLAADPETDVDALPWPEPEQWLTTLRASGLVAQGFDVPLNHRPVRLAEDLLYLERYWAEESTVRHALDQRAARPAPPVDQTALAEVLDALFDGRGLSAGEVDQQREAARRAAFNWTSVVAGGPGTGKTTTVARLLAVLQATTDQPLRIALAAPSGKAAARLQQAVAEALAQLPPQVSAPQITSAATLHKLLDARGAGRGFGRGPGNPLPHQVVVVDEMSMVALPLMARLLESLRPQTRLVLVGDPNQLTSVDAGAVLADLVRAAELPAAAERPPRGSVTVLTHTWRFGRGIADLAEAIRTGNAELALELLAGGGDVELVPTNAGALQLEDLPQVRQQVLASGAAVHAAAREGDVATALTALDQHRLLCAHREGRWGVSRWGRMVEEALRSHVDGYAADGEWYLGRPLLVTQNLRDLELSNGDSGVVVATASGNRAAIGTGQQARLFSPFLLDAVTSLHAMTVHKAQGSQFQRVTVVLPPAESSLLTRELLYTAVTRASSGVRLIGQTDAVTKTIQNPATRASGLGRGW
ncbi:MULTISPECIES: exodeoxyribonuclease V subunit alpha [unclassified Luteococcus]|uniref:exodeoxyribonuclease V subunit alpha n=1 Tax=unclassified Luteococcus TaxID=2639923 RepID=UPI00313CB749